MYQDLKKELWKLRMMFSLTDDYNKKRDLAAIIVSLEGALYDKKNLTLSSQIFGLSNKHYIDYIRKYNQWVDSLSNSFLDYNYSYFYNIFYPFMNRGVYRRKKEETIIAKEELIDIMSNFFKMIDENLYNVFQTKLQKQHLVVSERGEHHNFTVGSSCLKANYTVVDSLDTVSSMEAIVHEVGHAYFDQINGYNYDPISTELKLKVEIPSHILELLFLHYLIDNNIYPLEARRCLNEFNSRVFIYANCFRDKDRTLDSLRYLIGVVFAKQFYLDYLNGMSFNLQNIFRFISSSNLETIFRSIKIDYNAIINSIIYEQVDNCVIKM